jgi:hypothetical protein
LKKLNLLRASRKVEEKGFDNIHEDYGEADSLDGLINKFKVNP